MPSFETELHGPDEEVGKYSAIVHYDYNDEDGAPEVINLRIEPFKSLSTEKFPLTPITLNYHLETREYMPFNLEDESHDLYGAILIMLDETLGGSWGYSQN